MSPSATAKDLFRVLSKNAHDFVRFFQFLRKTRRAHLPAEREVEHFSRVEYEEFRRQDDLRRRIRDAFVRMRLGASLDDGESPTFQGCLNCKFNPSPPLLEPAVDDSGNDAGNCADRCPGKGGYLG